ncbi:hypothetical protein L914_09009 [Phytophthora nicotianae]|uniref:M96 mating-specific protein family n=1 Tax=Phytophthora nicotianae TaxID=4792 RepID=W2NEB1_PHYNI|nr:hypothetical protein L914_09009 [Phytophthora nicotianae]
MDALQATHDLILDYDLLQTGLGSDVYTDADLMTIIDERDLLEIGDDFSNSSEDDLSLAALDTRGFLGPTQFNASSLDESVPWPKVSSQLSKRRQRGVSRKTEIEALRKMATQLSKKIEEMKAADAKLQASSKNEAGNALVKTLWKAMASRQLTLRKSAEALNTNLRDEVVFQAKYAANLKRMLNRRYSEEMLESVPIKKRARRIVIKTSAENEQIFRGLLETINHIYAGIDDLFLEKGMSKLPCPGRAQEVYPTTVNGLFIELMERNQVPFSASRTGAAVWKAACGMKTPDGGIVDVKMCAQDTQQSEDIVTMYINYTCNAAGHSLNMQERRVGRKYVEEDRVVFVFVCLAELSSRSLGPLGLSFKEPSAVVVRKGPRLASGQETAVIETYVRWTRCDDGKEIASQFRGAAFVDSVFEPLNKRVSLFSARVENILFEDYVVSVTEC